MDHGDVLGAGVLQPDRLAVYEKLYKHLHANPELSNVEVGTGRLIQSTLSQLEVTEVLANVGGHGVVGIVRNGRGPTVLLRADIDALPIEENTGLPYSSTAVTTFEGEKRPVMHACGHDMHTTCLLAATEVLVKTSRDLWHGTLVVVFQPAEERGSGAAAMVADPQWKNVPRPDYLFGQHVVANLPAGTVGLCGGTTMAGAQSMRYKIYGRGGHASQPHRAIDVSVLAANIVVRLQQIVSRETSPNDIAVLTAIPLSAGVAENILPDSIEIGIDIRFTTTETRDRLLKAIHRVVTAECHASNAPKPPEFRTTRQFPLTINDAQLTQTLTSSFKRQFGDTFSPQIPVSTIAEDFPNLAQGSYPYVFWQLGCADASRYDLAGRMDARLPPVAMNHSAGFAPLIQPTLNVGVQALVVAALTGFADAGKMSTGGEPKL